MTPSDAIAWGTLLTAVVGAIIALKTAFTVKEVEKQGNSRWTEQERKLDAATKMVADLRVMLEKRHPDIIKDEPPEKRSHHKKDA